MSPVFDPAPNYHHTIRNGARQHAARKHPVVTKRAVNEVNAINVEGVTNAVGSVSLVNPVKASNALCTSGMAYTQPYSNNRLLFQSTQLAVI
jgi:hypothetical protein